MSSFFSNVKLNNYSLCTRLCWSGNICACNYEKKKWKHYIVSNEIFSQNFSKFSLHQILQLLRDAVGVHTDSACQHFFPCCISNQQVHWELYHRNSDTLERARYIAKQHRIVQLNYKGVFIQVSFETVSTWESFKHWGNRY